MDSSLPGPWADPERKDPKPWLSNEGIVKFIEFPARLESMSQRAFHLYWMRHHSPTVMNLAPFAQFMRKYNTGHVYPDLVAGLPARYRQDTPFEGAAEVWINDLAEVDGWLGHPLYAQLIQPDELRFIRQDGSAEVIIAKEERLFEPALDYDENGKTKVYVLMSREVGVDHDQFHTSVSDLGKAIVAAPTLRSYLRKLVLSHRLREPWPDGFPMAPIDVVLELWFESRSDVSRFYQDEACKAILERHESGIVDASRLRVLVTKMRVIHDEFSFQPSTTQPLSFSWED